MFQYEYEPTPADAEIFLSDEPMNLMKEQIKAQFENPLEKRFDYIGSFIESFHISFLDVETDDEENDIEKIYDDFMSFMLKLFEEKLDIAFPDFDNKGYEDQEEIIHMTYRYFLINTKHNFSNFCSHYIENNKKRIVESLPKKKDVTYLNLKKDGVDTEDNIIISNLYSIIEDIIHSDIDVDSFINNSDWIEPRLETDMVRDWFEDFSIVGDFCPKYVEMVDSNFIKEIECKIRNRMLKKYKKKKEE